MLGDIPYLYWNVDGIGDMLGDQDVLDYLIKFKIIVLAETKKGPSYKPKIPGYQSFPHPRKYKHPKSKRYDGGMIVFVADDILSSIKVDPVLEHLIWVSIKKNIIWHLYIYPHHRKPLIPDLYPIILKLLGMNY